MDDKATILRYQKFGLEGEFVEIQKEKLLKIPMLAARTNHSLLVSVSCWPTLNARPNFR
jgi:hypothetical protein